jgi:HD superfamily phosphohydrolase
MLASMDQYRAIPELQALRSASSFIRIPPNVDVPITPRIRRLIDTAAFQRLSGISQLGLVSLVYPGARHSRFEHSLGVYRNALLFLERLIEAEDFRDRCTPQACISFLVASLLHDIGHYPYAHAIEDMRLPNVDKHESVAEEFLNEPPLRELLETDFDLKVDDIIGLLSRGRGPDGVHANPLLCSMLSGPIDVDKFDYLNRDSMHAGVPYGSMFDQSRLIGQLCVDTERNRLAITRKGTTPAEMMVFARYIMFSEVYWHHAIRSASAMLQRLIFQLPNRSQFLTAVRHLGDIDFRHVLSNQCTDAASRELNGHLFGPQRQLYKRIAQYDILDASEIHGAIARRPFSELVKLGDLIAVKLAKATGTAIQGSQILVDAPPAKLEVQFDVRVRLDDQSFRNLEHLSPVVKTLATQQFDNIVKRVRLFAPSRLADRIMKQNLNPIVQDALDELK